MSQCILARDLLLEPRQDVVVGVASSMLLGYRDSKELS